MEPIDVGRARLCGVPALDDLWATLGPGLSSPVGDQQYGETFARAVSRVAASEHSWLLDPAEVLATHGARNALCHALVTLPADAPVYFPACDPSAAVPILRSGHFPVPVEWPLGATVADLLARIRRLADVHSGVVLHFPSKPAGTVPTDEEWEVIVGMTERHLVVLDDVYGFLDPALRPLGALVAAGGVVIDSFTIRMGAPGLRLGWLVADGERWALARESVACESGGVAQPVLELGARALEGYVAAGVRDAIGGELERRRGQLRESLVSAVGRRLVLGEHGFFAALIDLDGGPGVTLTRGPGYARLCLGAHADFGAVAGRLNDRALLIGL